jgi:hypothetical protein
VAPPANHDQAPHRISEEKRPRGPLEICPGSSLSHAPQRVQGGQSFCEGTGAPRGIIAQRRQHFHRLQEVNSDPNGFGGVRPCPAKGTASDGVAGGGSATVAPSRDDDEIILQRDSSSEVPRSPRSAGTSNPSWKLPYVPVQSGEISSRCA